MKKLLFLIAAIAILGLIVSGCIAPLKSVVPTSEKGNQKPELVTPTLEKITFVHYVKDKDHSKPVWDDNVDIYKFIVGGIKWENTMTYEVNSEGSNLDAAAVMTVLGDSLETWDSETSFELFADPTVLTDALNPGDLDNTNIVVWRNLAEIYGANVIAVNSFWFNPASKVIVDSDVVFSTNFDWSLSGEAERMDLQNIATHEFGHNGLNDLYMSPSTALTMYAYSDFGEIKKISLGEGDILGIQELYGL